MQKFISESLSGLTRFVCYIIFISPRFLQNAMAWWVGWMWFDVLRIRRRVAIENILRAFPHWSQKQAETCARASLNSMGQTLVEFPDLLFLEGKDLLKNVRFHGLNFIDAALEQKRGALFLGLHLSNGDYGIAALSQMGYPVHLISKRFSHLWLDRVWFYARGRHGTRFISPRNSSYDILKALKKNEIVIFVLDQYMGKPLGVRTTFFGHPTGTAMGLALFAQKTQSPVIPCYAVRAKDRSFDVYFEKPIPFEESSDKNTTLQFMTQKYTDKIQDIVTNYPQQWMWVHRRWKAYDNEPDN